MKKDLTIYPKNYRPILGIKDTEKAIKYIKDFFQINLAKQLNLQRISAPLFVKSGLGINDNLSGIEKPIKFKIKADKIEAEIIHSLAKWKRIKLAEYHFKWGEGIYTDMDAIRTGEERLDNLHSVYVDQWDWERIISAEERNLIFLKKMVKRIYKTLKNTEEFVHRKYPQIKPILPKRITFIHTEELEDAYPQLNSAEREKMASKKYGAIFLIGIGGKLKNGKPHDLRAPDYDDWSIATSKTKKGLNGDIIFWYPVLNKAFEISSMGIRVDKKALLKQLKLTDNEDRKKMYFHQKLLRGDLPLTIGGGIGQSRTCMFFLQKAHIGEVQSSVWPRRIERNCAQNNIALL